MRATPLFVCAALALGCSGRDPNETPDAGRVATGVGALGVTSYRCVEGAPTALVASSEGLEAVTPPWFTRGPDGVRAYARVGSGVELRWADATRAAAVPASAALREAMFGWAGERFVAVQGERSERGLDDDPASDDDPALWRNHRVFSLDADHGDRQALRTGLPGDACAPTVTELGGRALLTWHARNRRGCVDGAAWAQVLGPRGEALSQATPLSDRESAVTVRSLTARWDFGRAVVTGARSDTGLEAAWVLDASGAVLWSTGRADGAIACPRPGCVRVSVDRENPNGDGMQPSRALRFERLVRAGADDAIVIPATVTDVRAVATSGDRVLILHTPQSGTGCDLTVVDLALKSVVSELHDDFLACEGRRVRATPRGFSLAGNDTARGPTVRVIDCSH